MPRSCDGQIYSMRYFSSDVIALAHPRPIVRRARAFCRTTPALGASLPAKAFCKTIRVLVPDNLSHPIEQSRIHDFADFSAITAKMAVIAPGRRTQLRKRGAARALLTSKRRRMASEPHPAERVETVPDANPCLTPTPPAS